jgi:beta-lactamase superfamily II metal-dependent hydrolase
MLNLYPVAAPLTAANWWTEGEFSFVFFYMGQGDCMLAKCPDGKMMMVDCGSKAGFQVSRPGDALTPKAVVINTLNALVPDKKIDSLILTHPDRDHYNRVKEVLTGFKVDTVCLSMAYGDESPMGNYTELDCNNTVLDSKLRTLLVREFTVRNNSDGNLQVAEKRWYSYLGFQNAIPFNDIEEDYILLAGNENDDPEDDEAIWSVKVIAGNVTGPVSGSNQRDQKANKASLVTRFEINGYAVLIMGDSDYDVENFLMDKQAELTEDVELLQAGHHGSTLNTTSQAWATHTDPSMAAISVEYQESSHKLPDIETVNRLLAGNRLNVDIAHPVDSWERSPDYYTGGGSNCRAGRIYNSWLPGTYSTVGSSGNRYKLNVIPATGVYMVVPSEGLEFKRQRPESAIWSTSLPGNGMPYLHFTLTGEDEPDTDLSDDDLDVE